MDEDEKVLNGYGVLFALCVAEASGKSPDEIIDLLNMKEPIKDKQSNNANKK